MDSLDRETVMTLARHLGWPAVSIFMQTHPGHAKSSEDQLRFKNLLKDAERRLEAGAMRSAEIESLLAWGQKTLSDGTFWRSASTSLAAFFAKDVHYTFAMDAQMPERVDVSDRFVIRPLVSALESDDHYFVLALSQNRVRVLEGCGSMLAELEADGIPSSLAEALKHDDYERNVQFHTRTPAVAAGKGRRAAGFHGHGGIPDNARKDLERYFRMIDRGMADLLHGENAPLIIAGVEYLVPLYREVNSYPGLVEEAITGNPDDRTESDLALAATDLLDPLRERQVRRDLAVLDEAIGTGSASHDLTEIIPAAHEGRVATLFVSPGHSDWGSYDPANGRVDVRTPPQPGDWDLTDLAAAETLLHGGDVHTIERDRAASAIFRY